ncbi:MAG: hypothetical protein HY846_10500 [Nitrosomonadales bacterium]|nr:hypothetical protein [Nitrosomonadales bacterium]
MNVRACWEWGLPPIFYINTYIRRAAGDPRLFDRDDQFWRHSLNLDGAKLEAY